MSGNTPLVIICAVVLLVGVALISDACQHMPPGPTVTILSCPPLE